MKWKRADDGLDLAEREYKCLGLWTDKGLTYTYTERRDIFGYECFVGVIINEAELFIKEAGENCQRDVEPLRLGMKLTRQGIVVKHLINSSQTQHDPVEPSRTQ